MRRYIFLRNYSIKKFLSMGLIGLFLLSVWKDSFPVWADKSPLPIYEKSSSAPLISTKSVANGATSGTPATSKSSLTKPAQEQQGEVAKNYGQLPLSFEINQGQTDEKVKFLARGSGYQLFLT